MIKNEFIKQEKCGGTNLEGLHKSGRLCKYVLKKMDYEHLRAQILSNAITDHHALLEFVNNDWALPLGFQMKIKRAPKPNKQGLSIRIYCNLYNSNQTEEDCDDIHEQTGLREEYCYFGLSFKQVPLENKHNKKRVGIWILNTDYSADRMYHNHPFYYTYKTKEEILGTIYVKPDQN